MNLDGRVNPDWQATDTTSLSLLQRVKAQDQEAWGRLVDLYSPLVVAWCRAARLGEEDIADLLQDVFAIVANKIGEFRRDQEGDTFRGWLRVVTRNEIYKHFRKRSGDAVARGGSTAHVEIQMLPEEEQSPEDHEAERSGLYQQALELIRTEFEERTWKAFLQITINGRSAADVGADLGMTGRAARQAKYRVLRRLRSEFSELID